MGTTVYTEYRAVPNMKAAYWQAVDQARNEFGSNYYNGTISTSPGVYRSRSTPVTILEAEHIVDTAMENESTYAGAAAAAIPICEPDTKTRTRTIKVATTDPNGIDYPAVLAAASLNPGEVIVDFARVGAPTAKVAVTKAAGPASATRKSFQVHYEYGGPVWLRTRGLVVPNDFPTAAKATAAAMRHAKEQPGRYVIKASVVRVDGSPFAVITSEAESITQTVKITVGTVSDRTIVGWLFYGLAPC